MVLPEPTESGAQAVQGRGDLLEELTGAMTEGAQQPAAQPGIVGIQQGEQEGRGQGREPEPLDPMGPLPQARTFKGQLALALPGMS